MRAVLPAPAHRNRPQCPLGIRQFQGHQDHRGHAHLRGRALCGRVVQPEAVRARPDRGAGERQRGASGLLLRNRLGCWLQPRTCIDSRAQTYAETSLMAVDDTFLLGWRRVGIYNSRPQHWFISLSNCFHLCLGPPAMRIPPGGATYACPYSDGRLPIMIRDPSRQHSHCLPPA